MDRRQLVAGDQAIGFRARHGCVALHVGNDEVELGAAERLDSAGVIDHLDRQLRGGDAADPDLRHAAGTWIKRADVDRIGCPAAQRHGAERARRQYTSGLLKKFAPALPARKSPVRCRVINDGILPMLFHMLPPRDHGPAFCPVACYQAEFSKIRTRNLPSSKGRSTGYRFPARGRLQRNMECAARALHPVRHRFGIWPFAPHDGQSGAIPRAEAAIGYLRICGNAKASSLGAAHQLDAGFGRLRTRLLIGREIIQRHAPGREARLELLSDRAGLSAPKRAQPQRPRWSSSSTMKPVRPSSTISGTEPRL